MGKRIEPLRQADNNDELPELTTDQPETKPATGAAPTKQPAAASVPTDKAEESETTLPSADAPEDKVADAPVVDDKTDDATETGMSTDNSDDSNEPDIPAIVTPEADEDDPAVVIQSGRSRHFGHWLGGHKKVVIPIILFIVAAAVLAGVPVTRYALAGMLIKQQYSVAVVDSQTGKPVSSATVSIKGQTAQTNSQGQATVKVPVGKTTLTLQKSYYQTVSQEVLVPIKKPSPLTVKFTATGRQVPVTIINKVTGKPVSNAKLTAQSTQVITDKKGEAVIVLPAGKTEVDGTVTAGNYNKMSVKVKITAAKDDANNFKVTPAGKVYFLSNANGTVDVVKTDLDGQNRQTVIKGTGKEDSTNTVLLASQSWKYLALLSKRDGGNSAKLYLIDTSTDAMTTMDEGDADFVPAGWSGTTFIYRVDRHSKQIWDTKAHAVKSYDASTKKLATLDETTATGSNYSDYYSEFYNDTYILNNEIVFSKGVQSATPSAMADHQAMLISIRPDGTGKKVIKSWPGSSYSYLSVITRPYNPNELYFGVNLTGAEPAYEYEGGQVKEVAGKKATDIWDTQYFTYLFSPSNDKTFWSEPRDGKSTLFIGDTHGENKVQLATLTEYATFGWYTDNYVLLSKNNSELYIVPAGDWGDTKPLKVTDYFKPNFSAPGYGKGYGGV